MTQIASVDPAFRDYASSINSTDQTLTID